ncbi:MAG: sulfite exporter TauE/SafE family protein [Phaeodactylibacter sp.]|nr:sulfite exporter TauE/SafE family protein [Phaeodactylibacter sp.]MCB9050592.1 sulfite exporter TauE/SafE family protein [Lewinellaceae bacterium]
MQQAIASYFQQLSPEQWFWLFFCALLIGLAKAGVKGTGMFAVPIMAAVFGGKTSVGLLLPLLSMADVFAVSYYNRHAEWKYIWRLLPAAVVGVGIGIWVGYIVDDDAFDGLIAIIIISSLVLMIVQEYTTLSDKLISSWAVASIFGVLGGFSTMIGNAAGTIMAVYLLATRIPKNNFIGTTAWFFLIINLFKFPFHIFIWGTITAKSFLFDLAALPAIVLGVFLGIRIVRFIPEKAFRYFVIVMTFIISLRLLLA